MKTKSLFNCLPTIAILAMAILIGLAANRSEAAQPQDVPVVVKILEPNGPTDVIRISGDLVRTALLGTETFSTYDQKLDLQLKSFIGLDGQLRFHTYDSPTRSTQVNFTSYVGVTPGLPFTDARLVQGNIVTLGEDTDGNGVLPSAQLEPGSRGERFNLLSLNFVPGQTRKIGLQLTFPIGLGKTIKNWRIRWGGGETAGGFTAGLVTVQRLSASTWMIYAGDSDSDRAAVTVGGATTVGVYRMPFSLLVEIPN